MGTSFKHFYVFCTFHFGWVSFSGDRGFYIEVQFAEIEYTYVTTL